MTFILNVNNIPCNRPNLTRFVTNEPYDLCVTLGILFTIIVISIHYHYLMKKPTLTITFVQCPCVRVIYN